MPKPYDDIDRELIRLSEASRRLRRERNALTPTCRLPPEVLAMIFVWVVDVQPLGEPHDFTVPRIKHWYPLLHVCRRWRDVALECPVLWNRVDVTNPCWTTEMLRLSKKAPLTLKAEGYSTRSRIMDACNEVLAHSDRLRSLHLSGFHDCLTALCASVTEGPDLRSLVLRHCHWLADVNILELPATFLERGAPRLERLELQKCVVAWDSPLLTSSLNLVKLVIQGIDKHKPTYPQLLRMLSNMPSLQHLHLDNVLPLPYPSVIDITPIPLSLQSLHVSGTPAELGCFFRHFSVTASASLTITCRKPLKVEEVTDFVSALVQSRHAPAAQGDTVKPLKSWSLSFTPDPLVLCGSVDVASTEMAVKSPGIDLGESSLSLTVNMPLKDDIFLWKVVQALLHDLPVALESTTNLVVNDDAGFMDCDRWQYLIQHIPNVLTLRAFRWAALHLPLVLDPNRNENPECGKDAQTARLPFPRLETLDLHNVNTSWTVSQASCVPYLHLLQDVQIARSNCTEAVPIFNLRLSGCLNIGNQEYKTLCHLFTEVDWDGFELYIPTAPRLHLTDSVDREGEWVISFGWDDWHTM
ncbi:hypothetical protein NM688_g2732 [Phlebia brevispora]|uniref:Uncharacterized protein n=1 Tax=Phlebia brevispora TaxID=194682 RepID=A0ACC1T7N4_9APHY|nr:hypothetical protein NM688_g2732 [Phlebia brevispora]